MAAANAQPVVLDARVVTGVGGGPDKTILNSPRFLRAAGYRMLCAYLHSPDDPGFATLRQRANELEAPLLSIPDRGPCDARVLRHLARICREEHVTVWHGHDYKSNVLGLLLQPFWPMRLVTTVHGWGVRGGRRALYYKIDRLSLPFFEKVLCVSEDLRRECLAAGVAEENCRLLENGIDTDYYTRRSNARDAKQMLGIPADRVVIGAVGRLSAEKGFELLTRAVGLLWRAGHDVHLVIVGEGEERPRLEALVDELGLQTRVLLAGYCSDPRTAYEAFDVYALSSLREGLPNALLEALAMEIAVVATQIAGVPALIEHERNGLLIPPADQGALADSLRRLVMQPQLRSRLASAGRRTAVERYSFAHRMEKLVRIYDSMLCRLPRQNPLLSFRKGKSGGPDIPVWPARTEMSVPPDMENLTVNNTLDERDFGMDLVIQQHRDWRSRLPELEQFLAPRRTLALSRHPAWLGVLENGLDQEPYLLEARRGSTIAGFLALTHVRSVLFGRFLVSLPYLNSGGVLADEPEAARGLMDHAILLANDLKVRHLELRHETAIAHSQLIDGVTNKVHMRRALPANPGQFWDLLSPKVRNQVRKGQKAGLSLAWGREELLDDFYAVFSRNMRDLGTPVYARRFFACILKTFAAQAELCVLRLGGQSVAAALLLHGRGVTEVPSASSLREFNASCANMLMYWRLLERAVERGQQEFDFGRSTMHGSTYRFKKQWGAVPQAAAWQYHIREGKPGEMRPENPRFRRLIQLWRRLPVPVANFLGPRIVRGIP